MSEKMSEKMSATKTRLDVLIDRQAANYDGRTEGGRIAKDARAELAALRGAVNEARVQLQAVKDHHIKLNNRHGRPISDSYTISLCDAWLAAHPADGVNGVDFDESANRIIGNTDIAGAAYEQRMTDARAVFDLARTTDNAAVFHALMVAWRQLANEEAERKT